MDLLTYLSNLIWASVKTEGGTVVGGGGEPGQSECLEKPHGRTREMQPHHSLLPSIGCATCCQLRCTWGTTIRALGLLHAHLFD